MAKHLARCGWDVEVVTLAPELLANPQPGVDVRVNCAREHIRLRSTGCDWMFLTAGHTQLPRPLLRFPAKVVRQVPKWLGWEPMLGWQAAAVRACAPLRPGDADMVLASAPPYTGFSAAAIVAQRLLSPLILDYRDPWSQNPHRSPLTSRRIRSREAALLTTAQGLTVVSPAWAENLRREFAFAKPIEVVTNGYDPDEFVAIEPTKFDDFAVVYAGRFYPPKRTIHPIIAAVVQANKERAQTRPVRLHYFGGDYSHVQSAAAELGADAWVVNHGNVSRKNVLAALGGAGAAAVITTIEPTTAQNDMGIIPAKLFEAVGARTPVLLVSPEVSDATRLVREHSLGGAFSGSATVAMGQWLAQLSIGSASGSIGNRERFSWITVGTQLDSFLRKQLEVKDKP
ncbi:MAG: glycosyltransferase [Verrucomicrobia bacterium]|nr:glycosyltransferase [Verrucomicrobiota bacterium]